MFIILGIVDSIIKSWMINAMLMPCHVRKWVYWQYVTVENPVLLFFYWRDWSKLLELSTPLPVCDICVLYCTIYSKRQWNTFSIVELFASIDDSEYIFLIDVIPFFNCCSLVSFFKEMKAFHISSNDHLPLTTYFVFHLPFSLFSPFDCFFFFSFFRKW